MGKPASEKQKIKMPTSWTRLRSLGGFETFIARLQIFTRKWENFLNAMTYETGSLLLLACGLPSRKSPKEFRPSLTEQ
jgi:hypothetical protein